MTNSMTENARYDRAVQRKVADRYRRMGYHVVERPQREDLPFDLGDFQPALLATKPGDGRNADERYIIEVKGAGPGLSVERYLAVADLVAQHAGWRFLLITEEEPLARLVEDGEPVPLTWQEIDRRLERAAQHRSRGEDEARFLTLWPAFEAALRNHAEEALIPLERVETSSLLNHLYSLGELSMEHYDVALDLLRTHTLLVHGFQAHGVPAAADRLTALLQEVVDEWRPGQTAV